MKLVKTASGKMSIKLSKQDWMNIGKKQGWVKVAQFSTGEADRYTEYQTPEEEVSKTNTFSAEVSIDPAKWTITIAPKDMARQPMTVKVDGAEFMKIMDAISGAEKLGVNKGTVEREFGSQK